MCVSLRGQFLIAAKHLRDCNFFKSVVLIVEHGEQGAMGLVVNRPSSILVAHALSKHFDLAKSCEVVFLGGPVEPSALYLLHDRDEFSGGEEPVVSGLYAGCDADVFGQVIRAIRESDEPPAFRVFAGCAGWAPGQLEGELERGDWHVVPACPDLVFHEDPYAMFDLARRRLSSLTPWLASVSGDHHWN